MMDYKLPSLRDLEQRKAGRAARRDRELKAPAVDKKTLEDAENKLTWVLQHAEIDTKQRWFVALLAGMHSSLSTDGTFASFLYRFVDQYLLNLEPTDITPEQRLTCLTLLCETIDTVEGGGHA